MKFYLNVTTDDTKLNADKVSDRVFDSTKRKDMSDLVPALLNSIAAFDPTCGVTEEHVRMFCLTAPCGKLWQFTRPSGDSKRGTVIEIVKYDAELFNPEVSEGVGTRYNEATADVRAGIRTRAAELQRAGYNTRPGRNPKPLVLTLANEFGVSRPTVRKAINESLSRK